MKCAPVQIRRGDEKPNVICQKCHSRLEKTYQFQMQIIQSDKTLQCYLDQLHVFDKKTKFGSSIQMSSGYALIDNINTNNAEKCESSEFHDEVDLNVNLREKEYEKFHSASEINIKMPLKSEMKDEEENSGISPDCADGNVEVLSKGDEESLIKIRDSKLMEDMNVNWKVEESSNLNSACKSIEEMFLKSEIKNEPMDEDSLILTESIDATVNDFSNGVNKISCEATKGDFSHTSGKSACFRSSGVGECFEEFKEEINNTRMDREKHKKSSKLKSYDFKMEDTCSPRECKKSYTKSRFLKTHKCERTSEKSYQCDVCDKCFTRLGNLKVHKLLHTGEKPYRCDVCNKCFTQSGALNIHRLIHTSEKRYQCDVCHKCFTQSAHLKTHKLLHTGKKPYQCDVCNRCFSTSGQLNTHKLVHTSKTPYQCDVCIKSFNKSYNLKAHKLIHTGEKPYRCDVCNECFTRSNKLKSHKLRHIDEQLY